MSIQFFPQSTSNRGITSAQNFSSGVGDQSSQQFYRRSSLASLSTTPRLGFCQWLLDFLKKILPCLFSSSDPVETTSIPGPIVSNSSRVGTLLPITPLTSQPISSVHIPTTATSPSITTDIPTRPMVTTTTPPSLATFEGRIAKVKSVIHEHIARSDNRRNATLIRRVPQNQTAVIIRLQYNGQETAFVKNWADPDLIPFVEAQVGAFLSRGTTRDRADDRMDIRVFVLQKRTPSLIVYDYGLAQTTFPSGHTVYNRELENCSPQELIGYLGGLLHNGPERTAIQDFIRNLPAC
jgi:hypothetical protein